MRIFIIALSLMGSAAMAKELAVTCDAKAYGCYRAPGGTECSWSVTSRTPEFRVIMSEDRQGVWRANLNLSYDGHLMVMDFVYDETREHVPLRTFARLEASNVMAESSGSHFVDVALRNHNYGRGLECHVQ